MADNFLNKTGLTYLVNKLKTMFASKTEFNALDDKVDEIIAEGGEPNVIETVKVNGSALTPDANKAVNVSVPTTVAELNDASDYAKKTDLPTKTSDLTNDGDGNNSPYATEAYVGANGGKIDKIKVNGTEQPIANKAVDITVPTKTSDLTNDSNFQDDQDVQDAINAKIGSAYKAKGSTTFANLPALQATNEGNVYGVTDAFTTTSDFVEGAGKNYPAGTNVVIVNNGTEQSPNYKYDVLTGIVDLSGYWAKNELTAITTAEIDTIVA